MPLRGEERPRRGLDARDRVAPGHVAPVAPAHVDPALRVEKAEGVEGRVEAGDATRGARHDHTAAGEAGRGDRVGGDVAGTAQVLEQRAAHDVLVEQGQERAHA